jgi:hypothetical protein
VEINEDDIIWAEVIEDTSLRQPLVGVYKDPDGMISFQSSLSPYATAKLFAGLAHHILENNLG